MDCLEMIYTRRSIRKYSGRKIKDVKIEKILKAAMLAPSAGNEQPWHFIVVRDKERLKKLAETHPYGKMLASADAAIAVCAELSLSKYKHDMWVQDCSAATQNILLSARMLGIGSVWLGVYPVEDRMKSIAELLEVPDGVVVFSLVSLGYPESDDDFYEADRYRGDRVHLEKW
ncbi:Nitroreductase [Archaeoglobus sulfaticallidus PM70-1]|uniref:Nitroreductase n=1 Tax=Archaeoglobus sulfaticallidus PM70-1 TaxID=387631 RepID=N0BIG2_9EURY|nr:nitroreductase family protein [Archaeoglobus sulfaticallidus]AGK62087.1 Nitroreductase [Archaeoglobus sulfaticallidus PM70-1]